MKTIHSILIFFSLLLLVSCETITKPEITTGDLSGTITDKNTGETLKDVQVELSPGGYSTVTGSNGTFIFEKLEPNKYTISFFKEGYQSDSTMVSVKKGYHNTTDIQLQRTVPTVHLDKDLLDFGENPGITQLSFSIINPNYKPLEWAIQKDCEWIKNINPNKGTLKHGEIASIIVQINRKALKEYKDTTNLIVWTSQGKSEIKVTASTPSISSPLIELEEIDISGKDCVRASAEILSMGDLRVNEYGFVYSAEPNPTIENCINSLNCKETNNPETQIQGIIYELTPGTTYYFKAYISNRLETVYSTKEIKLTFNQYIEFPEYGIAIQTSDLGRSSWITASQRVSRYHIGGFSDWRLPTRSELELLYKLHHIKKIGTPLKYEETYFGGPTYLGSQYYNYLYMGYRIGFGTNNNLHAKGNVRAVRTLKK